MSKHNQNNSNTLKLTDDNYDNHVDDTIKNSLKPENPKSFFLFAGAGSGKTRSLVDALKNITTTYGRHLQLNGQQIAVITYTNAASDEIKHRLHHDPLIEVSTIHSFVWKLIKGFDLDIKQWVIKELESKLEALKLKQTERHTDNRQIEIEEKESRLSQIISIKKFSYNPNSLNSESDSLNHSEVLAIGSSFLTTNEKFRNLMVTSYPILLIDESQDTKKDLMDAFLLVQKENKKRFSLGLLGDTMQRIYMDGKKDLGVNLPTDWQQPTKVMNHRSRARVVELINNIRSNVDNQTQKSRSNKTGGHCNLFIVKAEGSDRKNIEKEVANKMVVITGDKDWRELNEHVKCLVLEHSMAAKRLGFYEMFSALSNVSQFKTALAEGNLSIVKFFTELLLPIYQASLQNDDFSIATVVRNHSELISKKNLETHGESQMNQIKKAYVAIQSLQKLWSEGKTPTFHEVLKCVYTTGLFLIPESLSPFAVRENLNFPEADEAPDNKTEAITLFLQTEFSQIAQYQKYVTGNSTFDTHQGVKGLQFPRVLVIMDDQEAGGNLFSYEKLFGVTEKTSTDLKNEKEGKETSIDRTKRLLYVTCSRAIESLAIIAYSADPIKVKEHVLDSGWFTESEIEILRSQ